MRPLLLFMLYVVLVGPAGADISSIAAERSFPLVDINSEAYLTLEARWRDESLRRQVLSALSNPERNRVLGELVGKVDVAGEDWFDLRGITVKRGELGRGANLRRLCLDGARFGDLDLRNAEIGESLIRGGTFQRVDLSGADFQNAELDGTSFWDCQLEDTNFRLADFGGTGGIYGCNLIGTRFDHAGGMKEIFDSEGDRVDFFGGRLDGLRLADSRLKESVFIRASLRAADFSGTVLQGVDFTDADLSRALLNHARIEGYARFVRTIFDKPLLGDLDMTAVDIRYIEWKDGGMIGEEAVADLLPAVSRSEARRLYSQAENAYRTLAHRYAALSYREEAALMRFRSRETRRKLLALDPWRERSPEWIRLFLRRWWDDYGTSLERLFWLHLSSVSFFAVVYWTLSRSSRSRCFERMRERAWSEVRPAGLGGSGGHEGENSHLAERVRPSFWSLWLFSLESSLLFARRLIDVRELGDYFRNDIYRLEAVGRARMVVGVEATIGLVCFSSLIAHVLEWIGSG